MLALPEALSAAPRLNNCTLTTATITRLGPLQGQATKSAGATLLAKQGGTYPFGG